MRYLGDRDGRTAAESLVGQRIGQLILRKAEPYRIQVVSDLSQTERGGKGFGSSGV
jgi:dUTPase